MKSFIFFIGGLAIGAVGSFFVTKYICEAKSEAKIAKETADARNFYKEKYEKDSADSAKEAIKKSYAAITKPYLSKSDDIFEKKYSVVSKDEDDYRDKPIDNDGNKRYIHEVPEDEIEYLGYSTYSLDYYQDGTLVDMDDNIVDDPMSIAGEYLDELSLTKPEIFVCNDATKTVYDICYVAASYEQPGGEYD